jgi:plasmid maintenance system antidote protein VapI
MVRIPSQRAPTHPGEMLLEEFLKPMGLSQRELADAT